MLLTVSTAALLMRSGAGWAGFSEVNNDLFGFVNIQDQVVASAPALLNLLWEARSLLSLMRPNTVVPSANWSHLQTGACPEGDETGGVLSNPH